MFNSKLLNYQRVLHFNKPPIYSLKSWQLIHPPPGEGLRPLSATSKTPSKMSEDLQFQLDLGELHETPKSTISPWYSHDIPMMCPLYPYYIPMTSLLGGWPTPHWKIWKSDWIIIPTIGENKNHVPNHQPDPHCIPKSLVSSTVWRPLPSSMKQRGTRYSWKQLWLCELPGAPRHSDKVGIPYPIAKLVELTWLTRFFLNGSKN